ncbi:MAG: hypothetical protein AAFV59_11370 [Pseudomonadota bacterium]
MRVALHLISVFWLSVTAASAGVMSFEHGFSEGDFISSAAVGDITVDLSCGSKGDFSSGCAIAKAGAPTAAFVNEVDVDDQSENVSQTGLYSLTDIDGLKTASDYSLLFSSSIKMFSVDLIDFRADGGAEIGDLVELRAFDTLFGNIVASISFSIEENWSDGLIRNLALTSATGFQYLELVHSRGDVGTAIDNIEFSTVLVSEPANSFFYVLALLVVLRFRYLFNRKLNS